MQDNATIMSSSFPLLGQVKVMRTAKFWPLDYEPEDEIYDSPAWDLPGYRKATLANSRRVRQAGVPSRKIRL